MSSTGWKPSPSDNKVSPLADDFGGLYVSSTTITSMTGISGLWDVAAVASLSVNSLVEACRNVCLISLLLCFAARSSSILSVEPFRLVLGTLGNCCTKGSELSFRWRSLVHDFTVRP